MEEEIKGERKITIKTDKFVEILKELEKIAEKYNIKVYETSGELILKKIEMYDYEYNFQASKED